MKPPTIRQRVLDVLRASDAPLSSAVAAKRARVPHRSARGVLLELRRSGEAVRVPPCKWRASTDSESATAVVWLPALARPVIEALLAEGGPVTSAQVALRLGTHQVSVCRALRALEAAGHIARQGNGVRNDPCLWSVARPIPNPEPPPARKQSRIDDVRAALRGAPDGLTSQEIASITGRAINTVTAALRRLDTCGEVDVDNKRMRGRCLIWRAVEPNP